LTADSYWCHLFHIPHIQWLCCMRCNAPHSTGTSQWQGYWHMRDAPGCNHSHKTSIDSWFLPLLSVMLHRSSFKARRDRLHTGCTEGSQPTDLRCIGCNPGRYQNTWYILDLKYCRIHLWHKKEWEVAMR
jgi:hypothetical protein